MMARSAKSAQIAWGPELAVGIAELDAEHRALVEAINAMVRLLAGSAEQAEFNIQVDHLIAVAEAHFANEEALMDRHAAPQLRQHQREHEELLEDLATLRLLAVEQARGLPLSHMLRDWLVDHVLHFDRAYTRFIEPHAEPD
jgi:hemerythrin